MKYNKLELLNLASQSSNRFVKEGSLIVYERQDGSIFKRQESFCDVKSNKSKRRSSLHRLGCYGGFNRAVSERWCRLRGNLLFYFKSRDAWSEPAGVILLEIGNIRVDPVPNEGMWPFTIVMACGGGDQRLAAISEIERDSWIEELKKASYSSLQAEVQSLKNQLQRLQQPGKESKQDSTVQEAGELPISELSVACDNLRCDGHGWPPSPQAVLSYFDPSCAVWKTIGSTERIADCSNPTFLVTLPLWNCMGMESETRLRLTVNDVRESMTCTQVLIGTSEFSVSSLVKDSTSKKRFPLISATDGHMGFATLSTHTVIDPAAGEQSTKGSSNPQSPSADEEQQQQQLILCHRRTQSLPPRLLMELRRPSQGWIGLYFANPATRSYRFHSGLGGDIVVHESMLESRLGSVVPAQLLRLWIGVEKDLVRELVALGQMVPSPWQQRMLQLLERHFRRIGDYTQALESVETSAALFRASVQKDKSTLQYCPVNLHLQRLWAHNGSLRKEATFDCVTVGAFTAIPHGFKGGGLYKLLKNFNHGDQHADQSGGDVRSARQAVQTAAKTLRHLQGAVKLLLGASSIDTPSVLKIAESLVKKVRCLVALLDHSPVGAAISFFEKNRLSTSTTSPTLADFSLLPLRSMAERLVKDAGTAGVGGGEATCFYSASEEPEPLELIRINLEASLLALAGKLQSLRHSSSNNNNGHLKSAPGLAALIEKYQGRFKSATSENESQHATVDPTPPQSPFSLRGDGSSLNPKSNSFRHKRQQKWASELGPCLSKMLKAAQSLVKTLRLVHGVWRLKEELPRSAMAHSIQHRRDVCFSQALTAGITALIARISCSPVEPELMILLCKAGILLGVEGLLTPYRTEAGMWSDMAVAIEDLAAVTFFLVPVTTSSSTTKEQTKLHRGVPAQYLPEIHGCRESLHVTIPVPATVFSAIPPSAGKPGVIEFQLIPIFFNIGINEQALLAEKFGDMTAVNATNHQSFDRLESYHRRYLKLMTEFFPGKRLNDPKMPLTSILSQLQTEIALDKIQNTNVHQLAGLAVRKMKGLRMTCCKSAKDRTGMAVTLEQANILSNEFDLAAGEFTRSLDCMRSQGTRRINTMKNVGVDKFAFNRLQLMAFPQLYRPPSGTFGNVIS